MQYNLTNDGEGLGDKVATSLLTLMENIIFVPSDFDRPRYRNSAWYDHYSRWKIDDLNLLTAACDLSINPETVANALGRPPTNLAHKALDLGIFVPREWRRLITPTKAKKDKLLNLSYPYIVKPDTRHEDLIAINRMISNSLPGREDVCQDIMLALWESSISISDLQNDPAALRKFITSFKKASFERSGYGVESMDITLYRNKGDGKSKYEDERFQHSLGSQVAEDFSEALIDKISSKEKKRGIPAAFWSRVGNTKLRMYK